MSSVRNFHELQSLVENAAQKSNRNIEDIKIVAASKKQEAKKIREYFGYGQKDFGENYWQEAEVKKKELNDLEINWHFIGGLQSNKVKQIVGEFSLIHSVDRLSVASEISKVAIEKNRIQNILIQVNIANEKNKSGCAPEELPGLLQQIQEFSGISINGLMAMPPLVDDEKLMRNYFSQLKSLQERVLTGVDSEKNNFKELSMGTSQDFLWAIAEGATIVRLGTRLLGPR